MNMIIPSAYENIGEMVEEIRHLRKLLKKQQAVVDAAREVVEIRSCTNRLRKALRALDGEP